MKNISLQVQSSSRSDERKAGPKRGASRINNTVQRALQGTNAAIAENGYGQTGYASLQVTETREF